MKLLIIRHGDPDYSIDSLTEKGWREVEFLSQRISRLDVAKVYCSPLGRAKDTAKPTLEKLNMTAEICDWLREFPALVIDPESKNKIIPWDMMPASWTGNKDYYDNDKWTNSPIMQSGDVEEKLEAVKTGIDELLIKHGYRHDGNIFRAENPNCDTVVLFCHFGVECVILSHLTGISPMPLWHNFIALPSSVTTLITEEREEGTASMRIAGFGDLSHLYSNDEPPAFAGRFCEIYKNFEERH